MDLIKEDKSLVSTVWQHKNQLFTVVVKEQFRVGSDIEPWVDCRDSNDVCWMMRADDLARDYTRVA